MTGEPYSAAVRELFNDPHHVGDLADAATVRIDDQGMQVELHARAKAGDIQEIRFRAWGCPHLIAATEAFCAGYEGRPVADIDAFAAAELMQSLPVPVEKTGRILVLEDAVRALGNALRETPRQRDQ